MISTRQLQRASRIASQVLACRPAGTLAFLDKQVPYRSQIFIDNEWHNCEQSFEVTNPANGDSLFMCASASATDVDRAVQSSRKCFDSKEWKALSGKERGDMMRKMASLLEEQQESYAMLECLDNGKPITEAREDIATCVGTLRYYAGLADDLDATRSKSVATSDTDFNVREVKEPIGVVGMITPWNYPLMQAIPKIAPAFAAGCTMVLKPSEVCSATVLRFGEIAAAAGVPAGAINLISGLGREAGAALIEHNKVDILSFTGSSATGQIVLHAGAKKLVPSLVELGGKGALVVFDDVDVEVAVDWIMVGIFLTAGQVCSATSRLIVHKDIEEKIMTRLVEEAKKIRIGDPRQDDTQLGSLTSEAQLKIVEGFVTRAVQDGAEVVCGGKKVPGVGCFYEPTILRNLNEDSEAWVEEIFGPVLTVMSFTDEQEAVRMANNTKYGLGSGVLSRDEPRCERVAQQLNAGVVWKNCSNALPTEASFGGFKKSGFGKEYGVTGMEEYLQTKVITGCSPNFSWEWYVPRKK